VSLRHQASRTLDRLLEPFGLEIKRRVTGGPRRSTMHSALRRLRALGFRPETVLDVGVATGTSALYETFPQARHVLVEPLREFEDDMKRIVAGLAHAEYVLAAASDHSGEVRLNVAFNGFLTSRLQTLDAPVAVIGAQRTVPAITLDEIWRSRALRGPSVVKIDVEGDELAVLEGAREVLRSCQYMIVEVQIHRFVDGAPGLDVVLGRAADLGFVLDDLLELGYGPRGNLNVLDAAFVPLAGWLRTATSG
jgi:FkbM family methyltransferase